MQTIVVANIVQKLTLQVISYFTTKAVIECNIIKLSDIVVLNIELFGLGIGLQDNTKISAFKWKIV